MEVPEPCRKARQARPLSLPQASRPSGLFKHIDPVSVALSAHPLRARPLSRDFEARCAQPGACVGGSGPGSKCRRGERATDLQYPATLAARFRVSHFVACCHAAQASPWGGGGGCVVRSARYHSTRLLTTEYEAAAFLSSHPPSSERTAGSWSRLLHRGRGATNGFGIARVAT